MLTLLNNVDMAITLAVHGVDTLWHSAMAHYFHPITRRFWRAVSEGSDMTGMPYDPEHSQASRLGYTQCVSEVSNIFVEPRCII